MKVELIFLLGLFIPQWVSTEYVPRLDLEFEIKVVYQHQVEKIGIRGNGLGLNWKTTSEMNKISDQVWSYRVKFQSDEFGFKCLNCTNQSESFISHGDKFKLRFYTSLNGEEFPSKGPTFDIPLPISKVSSHFEEKPSKTFYPYFFTSKGQIFSINVDSKNENLGTRNVAVYVPPGVLENPKLEYDRLFVIDMDKKIASNLKSTLDRTFSEGVAPDAVLIGYGDWHPDPVFQNIWVDRTNHLTQVPGDEVACKEGSFDDGCNYCLPWVETDEEYYYWMTIGGCGVTFKQGGWANQTLDFLLGPINEAVNTYLLSHFQIRLSEDRLSTFILGFSHGGLFSCLAGWTRPEVFGGVGCQSPSFYWPLAINNGVAAHQYLFSKTLLEYDGKPRPNMDLFIDVGGLETSNFYSMTKEAEYVYELFSKQEAFTKDINLWLNIYPGQNHSNENWLGRIYNPIILLLRNRF